jgi:hypothetical protein
MNTTHNTARRKRPWLSFAFVLLALTSFASAQSNSDLSSLVPSAGTLDPVFDGATIDYTATVPFATTSITVTPTVAEAGATVTVNTIAVISGDASDPIALSVGPNVISTEVTSQDLSTTKTYTLTVTRGAASTNADLSDLVPSDGTLDPVFDSGTIAYTATVPFATSSMTVTPTAAGTGATITVNSNPVASGSPSDAIALSVGANVISTEVTAEDGSTTKTYTLTVTREAASTNADLSGLVPSDGTLDPVFDSGTIAYAATVKFSISSLTVTPTTADANATITVNGNAVPSGSPSDAIALSVGANVISTEVTAEDGSTTKTYTLTVTRVVADLVTDFQGTIVSQLNTLATGEGRFFHVSVNPANPGTGSYAANIPGTNNPAPRFVRNFDGPILGYKFSGTAGNNVFAIVAQGGDTGLLNLSTTDTSFDGFGQNLLKLWTTTDPGSDIQISGPDPKTVVAQSNPVFGFRSITGASGTVDVSAIPAGSLHIYYGDYSAKPSLSVVMRDTDPVSPQPDIVIANAHSIADGGNNDTANNAEIYLAEIDFVTNGVYDEIEIVWTAGNGNGRGFGVVVTEAVADAAPPTLAPASIVDNQGGGPFTSTGVDSITYTVTYSEFMDPATIDASDFGLSGTASATIDSVVHYGGVTTVVVTPDAGTSGTLALQVNATADLTDLAGNALDTDSAIVDDPAVTIIADVTPPTLVSITDNVGGGPVLEGQTVVYTVTFDEPLKASSIGTDDFENGGSPAGVIAAVNATANPAVYEVLASSAYPGGTGTLILQIKSGATLTDLSSNPLATGSAIPDDTTITVNAQEARQEVTVDLPAASAENTSATLTLTYDASGSDKLVINATKEGNPNPYTTLTYEGQPLTLAVSTGSNASNQHWNGIYYLDNPGNYDNGSGPVGEIVATSGSSRNVITAVGLSNTALGVGATAAPPAPDNSKSVTIGLSYVNSAVIASHGMGQDGNTANVTSVNTISPLIEIAGSALENGNNWVGHVTGYAASQGPGSTTYSFTGGSTTGVNTIAAEFPGALVVTDPFAQWKVLDGATGVTFAGDANDDGVQDGLAFLLGAANPNIDANAAGLLPTVTESGGDLVMEFDCLATADRGTALLDLEYDGDLVATWLSAPVPGVVGNSTVNTATGSVSFVATANGDLIHIVATISDATESAGGKLFGRLEGTE